MTLEEFNRISTDKAIKAFNNNSNFRAYFLERIYSPNHYFREWEIDLLKKLLDKAELKVDR